MPSQDNVWRHLPFRIRERQVRQPCGMEQVEGDTPPPLAYGRDTQICEAKMLVRQVARMFAALMLAGTYSPAHAQAQSLDKVSFGTNWVAEAEHGGFYQALADGTYRKYGL